MKDNWKEYLEHDAGAVFNNIAVEHFGNPERESRVSTAGNTLMDLSQFGLIALHGEEASAFMQNLFCNDIREVDSHTSQLSAICNAKGRVIANFRIFMRGDSYYLQLPMDQVEGVLKRLQMYKMMSNVDILDASNSFIRIGCCGPTIEQELATVSAQLPTQANDVVQQQKITLIRLPGTPSRFELIGEFEAIKMAWQRLNVQAAPVGSYQWQLHDILNGLPNIGQAVSEAFVPQMVNMHKIDALSFTKGCYPGQEIVARSQYLGKLKRQMYLAHTDNDTPAQPGDEIFNCQSGEVAGKVVDCQRSADQGYELLAVLRIADAEMGGLVLGSPDGASIKIGKLPYQESDETG